MESIKRDGTMREQIYLEERIRREPDVLSETLFSKFTNESNLNPYVYGDDQKRANCKFLSKDISTKCRCGRPRIGVHILKCLRKEEDICVGVSGNGDVTHAFPVTSSGIIGWPTHCPYKQLERSLSYVSPKSSIPGGRIDNKPYSNIFIG